MAKFAAVGSGLRLRLDQGLDKARKAIMHPIIRAP